jgi:hypothetical protein
MGDKKVTITKMGEEASRPQPMKQVAAAKPASKSILKTARMRPVSDPAKSPPIKKSMKKHTIRLLTKKGTRQHRKTLRRKISSLSDTRVRQIASNYGLVKSPDTPVPILRQMIEGGAIAGFLSVD